MASSDCFSLKRKMHLYHHPFSMNSQKVRLALEEKCIDYVSHSLNPLKGRDLDADFFRVNPNGKIPVCSDGSHIICETPQIIQFLDSINGTLGGGDVDCEIVIEWMNRVNAWSSKLFTLSHIPVHLCRYVSKFKRRVAIARMEKHPELSSKYRAKLLRAYATEELLHNKEAVQANKAQLIDLLDMAEKQVSTTDYIAGASFSMADAMLIPVLGRLELLNVDKEYIASRPHLLDYFERMKQRPSYNTVIGNYFMGFNKHKTLAKTALNICIRDLFRRY